MIPARLPHVKFVFPDAPLQKVTANMGVRMPSWFDLFGIPLRAGQSLDKEFEDDESMRNSVQIIDDLIEAEVKAGIPENRIVVGGFSQGGALSLVTGLGGKDWRTKSSAVERKLAGVTVLSGWMPLKDNFQSVSGDYILIVCMVLMNNSIEDRPACQICSSILGTRNSRCSGVL
jgi:predicted esterase